MKVDVKYVRDRHGNDISVDVALRKLKKMVEKSGLMKELHEREAYERPGLRRNRKQAAAIMRWKRELRKNKLPPKLY